MITLLILFILLYQPPVYRGVTQEPRRITVYNEYGESRETPGGDNDDPNVEYRYNEKTQTWWYQKNGIWYQWHYKGDIFPFIPPSDGWYNNRVDWFNGGPNSKDAVPYQAVPIGAGTCLILFGGAYAYLKSKED